MTPALKVLAPGVFASVQDLGRVGFQRLGVPVSGVLDEAALRLGNALVGNPPGTAGIEILWSEAAFEVAAEAVRIAVAGPGARLVAEGEHRRALPAWQSVTLRRGETFRVVVGEQSACCVLAVAGGIAVAAVLGSASTYVRAGLGGLGGRALRRGDLVPLREGAAGEGPELRLTQAPQAARDQPIRVVLGPQQEWFAEDAVSALLGAEFRVSALADRMGMRLDGPPLRHRAGWDLVSDAIPTGAIQVPGSGQAILLLADHQTTGGYPKLATVAAADLTVVGRRRPGDAMRFAAISVDSAETLYREWHRTLTEMADSIEPANPPSAVDLAALYQNNLISGVVADE